MYHLITLSETDGELQIASFLCMEEIASVVKKLKLCPEDYCIIQGEVIKGFNK